MSLDKYVKKFMNGEPSAFDEIYLKTRKSVYYVALSVLKDRHLAEDVAQTAYLKAIKYINSYKIGSNFTAWIVTIAKNEAINLKNIRIRENIVDEKNHEYLFGAEKPSEYGELIDLARRLLPSDEFSILMLVTAEGYKRREIAKILDMPLSTVTWKYQNAVKKMEEALKKEAR